MRIFKLLLIFCLLLFGIMFVQGFSNRELKSPVPPKLRILIEKINPRSELPSQLAQTVERSLEGSKGKYAIVVKNFKTGESFYLNEQEIFEAASLYKLWVMAVVVEQIEKGELKQDEVLSADISYLNEKFDIDPEFAESSEGGITLSVEEALTQMITISHNYAALLLSEKVGLSNVQKFLDVNNLFSSDIGQPPQTSAKDTEMYFEKLYSGELGNRESTQKMIDLLKRQKLNGKLPKDLPVGVQVAHKTGEIGYFSHDAGIVFAEKGDYIIVVLSQTDSPAGAEERIATISRAVFDCFNKE